MNQVYQNETKTREVLEAFSGDTTTLYFNYLYKSESQTISSKDYSSRSISLINKRIKQWLKG